MNEAILIHGAVEFSARVAEHLFADYIKNKIKDGLITQKLSAAKYITEASLGTFISSIFKRKQNPSDLEEVVKELKHFSEQFQISKELIDISKRDKEKFLTLLLNSFPPNFQDSKKLETYKQLLIPITNAIIKIHESLPEWESSNWDIQSKKMNKVLTDLNKVEKGIGWLVDKQKESDNTLINFEELYTTRLIKDNNKINIKGIGVLPDVTPLSIDEIFVPIYLERIISKTDSKMNPKEHFIDDNFETDKTRESELTIEDIIFKYDKSIIVGVPGSGKSTLMKKLTLNTLYSKWGNFVPFVFRVRSIKDFDNLPTPLDFIKYVQPSLAKSESSEFVTKIINENRALLIIDGLDECELPPSEEVSNPKREVVQWDKLVNWIEDISKTYSNNKCHIKIVITSRPVGYQEKLLDSSGFNLFRIKNLNKKQKDSLIENWCYAIEKINFSESEKSIAKEKAMINAKDLIRKLNNAKSIQFLTETPLMLTAVCIVHRFQGQRLPERRVDLLDRCLDILIYEFRAAKHSPLDVDFFVGLDAKIIKGLLSPLAYQMTLNNITQADEELILTTLEFNLPKHGMNSDKAKQIIKIIKERCGVIIEVSQNVYEFIHLTFQEYLTAYELSKSEPHKILNYLDDSKWKEIIPMSIATSRSEQEDLISELLKTNRIELASRALIESEKINVDIRNQVVDKLSKACLKNSTLISLLSQLNDEKALKNFVKLIKYFKYDQINKHFEHLYNFKYNDIDKPFNLKTHSKKLAMRCKYGSTLSIGDKFDYRRFIFFEVDERGIDFVNTSDSGSWVLFNLGIIISEDTKQKWDDSIYAMAMMLDTISNFDFEAISNIIYEIDDFSFSIEQRLILFFILSYYINEYDDKKLAVSLVDRILIQLSTIENSNYPGLQIGLINSFRKNYHKLISVNMESVIGLKWRECSLFMRDSVAEFLYFTEVKHSKTRRKIDKQLFINTFKENFDKYILNK